MKLNDVPFAFIGFDPTGTMYAAYSSYDVIAKGIFYSQEDFSNRIEIAYNLGGGLVSFNEIRLRGFTYGKAEKNV